MVFKTTSYNTYMNLIFILRQEVIIMNKTSKKFKDPGSAITHLIAMIGAVICAFPLIGKAVHTNNSIVVFAMSVFISSMILLYGASTLIILSIFPRR